MSWYIELVKYVLLGVIGVVVVFKLWKFGKVLGNRMKGIDNKKEDEFDKFLEGY